MQSNEKKKYTSRNVKTSRGSKVEHLDLYSQHRITNYLKKEKDNPLVNKYAKDHSKNTKILVPEEIWEDIEAKYMTGQYSKADLAKMYGISEDTIGKRINKKGIKVDKDAVEALECFDKGFRNISNILYNARDNEDTREIKRMADDIVGMTSEDKEKAKQEAKEHFLKSSENTLDPLQKTTKRDRIKQIVPEIIDNRVSVKLANEVIELTARKNPGFARGFQSLSALMLKRASEILTSEKGISSNDIKNIATALKDLDVMMSIFPKQPTIAQQFNFGKNEKDKVDTDINLNVKIIGANETKPLPKPNKPSKELPIEKQIENQKALQEIRYDLDKDEGDDD